MSAKLLPGAVRTGGYRNLGFRDSFSIAEDKFLGNPHNICPPCGCADTYKQGKERKSQKIK